MFFHRDDAFEPGRFGQQQCLIQRLDKPGIDHSGKNAFSCQNFPGFQGLLHTRADGDDQQIVAVTQDFGFSDLQGLDRFCHGNARPPAPGIAQGNGSVMAFTINRPDSPLSIYN